RPLYAIFVWPRRAFLCGAMPSRLGRHAGRDDIAAAGVAALALSRAAAAAVAVAAGERALSAIAGRGVPAPRFALSPWIRAIRGPGPSCRRQLPLPRTAPCGFTNRNKKRTMRRLACW